MLPYVRGRASTVLILFDSDIPPLHEGCRAIGATAVWQCVKVQTHRKKNIKSKIPACFPDSWPNSDGLAYHSRDTNHCTRIVLDAYTKTIVQIDNSKQLQKATMTPTLQYHCPCLSSSPVPPPPHLPSSSYSFHPLHTLFFCEECDAVRCNRCVSVEVSTYYCPNCLFEVPSASVRAEKNRCVMRRIEGLILLKET